MLLRLYTTKFPVFHGESVEETVVDVDSEFQSYELFMIGEAVCTAS